MIIPWQDLSRSSDPALCAGGECLDGVLLQGLRDGLAAAASDSLLVLHMKGSHGPAYYKRSPPDAKAFKPECDTNALSSCSRESLVNVYDNSMVETDLFVARTIDWLKNQQDKYDTGLIYLSDHGESLGENGLVM